MFDPPGNPGVRGASVLARLYSRADGSRPTCGRHYSALAHLGAEVRGELESAEAWLELGRIALLRGKTEEASEFVCHALLLGTPHPDAALLISQVLAASGHAADAARLLASGGEGLDSREE